MIDWRLERGVEVDGTEVLTWVAIVNGRETGVAVDMQRDGRPVAEFQGSRELAILMARQVERGSKSTPNVR